jgi:hypothetical protein
MNEDKHEEHGENELTFGEKLLGMQGFSAARAARYRAEMEKLLVHRITTYERCVTGLMAILMLVGLTGGGIAIAAGKANSELKELDEARLPMAVVCALTGLLLGGWLLRIAIQGRYARRVGDVIGVVIALLFCGGWVTFVTQLAWATNDADLRIKLISGDAVLLAIMAGCLLMALLQGMHRETQEKLFRIEYHLAELLERNTESKPGQV